MHPLCSGTNVNVQQRNDGKAVQSAALQSQQYKMHESINAFDDNLVVIYNRVPKTGSTSFINLAYDLCKKNHFYVLHINITANMHVLSLSNQVRNAYFCHQKYKNMHLYRCNGKCAQFVIVW